MAERTTRRVERTDGGAVRRGTTGAGQEKGPRQAGRSAGAVEDAGDVARVGHNIEDTHAAAALAADGDGEGASEEAGQADAARSGRGLGGRVPRVVVIVEAEGELLAGGGDNRRREDARAQVMAAGEHAEVPTRSAVARTRAVPARPGAGRRARAARRRTAPGPCRGRRPHRQGRGPCRPARARPSCTGVSASARARSAALRRSPRKRRPWRGHAGARTGRGRRGIFARP